MCGQLGPLTFTLQPQWANTLACRTAMLSASTWTTRSVATIWRRPPGWVRMFVWTCVRSSCYFHSKWYDESGGLIHSTSGLKKKYHAAVRPQTRLFAVKTRSCTAAFCAAVSLRDTGWTSISPIFQHLLLMWAELQRSCRGFGPSCALCRQACDVWNAGFLRLFVWF